MGVGHIMSVESMGLVDGPGIRTVVFFQGCALRCRFCHNPDSWDASGGQTVTAGELMRRIIRFRPYFERGGGGVTCSGGEPLLQPDFLRELLGLCRAEGIHTCLDTAGVGCGGYEDILALCDLVLYDVKAMDGAAYRSLCGRDMRETERFLSALRAVGTPTVVRQVVVPGINDNEAYMLRLRRYVSENIPTAERVELLPYHLLGAHKYKALGIEEPLAGTPAMDPALTERWQREIFV